MMLAGGDPPQVLADVKHRAWAADERPLWEGIR
jgi:hypothetical protein